MNLSKAFKSLVSHLNPLTAFDIRALHRFCRDGNVEDIDKILNSKKLIIIDVPFTGLFSLACTNAKLEVVKYLLNSNNTKKYIPKDFSLYEGLYRASLSGYLGVIDYLLTSSDTQKYNCEKNYVPEVFKVSCETLNWHVVHFLMNSNELKENFNIHDNGDLLFKQLFNNKKTGLIQELIFDLGFEKTQNIEVFLNNPLLNNQSSDYLIKIKQMFDMRDLNNELNNGLKSNTKTTKRIKV